MKKSLKISLGGISFNVEDDAYHVLENYLASLKHHLGDTPESDEIVRDIEERAADLFSEMLEGKEIITIELVDKVIEILGKPEQISNEEYETNSTNHKHNSSHSSKRRIYRDGDNAIIGGVCSGLGAYFDVDPLVFRILFLVLLFAKGFGFLAYLILWIVVPRAKTVRQRMEMRGEKINFSNLEKNIKHEYEEVKKNVEKHRMSGTFDRILEAFGKIFLAIGNVLGVIIKIFAVILAVALISIGLIGLMASTVAVFLGELVVSYFPMSSGLTVNQILATTIDLGSMLWITIPVYFIVAIPLIAIVYLGLRMVIRFKARDSIFFVSIALLWIFSVVVLAFVIFFQARSFTIQESVKERFEIPAYDTSMRFLTLSTDNIEEEINSISDHSIKIDDYSIAYIEGKAKIVGKPRIFIGKSESGTFEIIVVKKSRGATRPLARRSANDIVHGFTIVDSNLVFNPYFSLPYEAKWRAQDVEVIINIPEGKGVYIDESLEHLLSTDQEFSFYWPDELVGKRWIMKGDRLVEHKE